MKKSKLLRKISAVAMAGVLAFSSLTVFAAQDASGLADGTAYLNINNADWGEFEAEWTNAEITGDGSYTVAMKAAEPQKLAQFNALEVVNGEATLGTGCVITVDAIKINGEDVELQGPSYTCSADGGGVTTRVNIYNEWNAPDATAVAGDDNHVDHRVAEGNLEDATAMLFSNEYVDSSSGSGFEVSELEVSFTVSGYGTAGAEGAVATVAAEGPAIAHLVINNADWAEYEAEYVDAEITGDGEYTVSMTAKDPQKLAQFNALQVENGELLMGTECVLTVNSIKINGEEVELQGPSYTCSADGGGVTTRVNLYNEWNAPDATAVAGDDNHADHRVAEGNLEDATAMLFSNEYVDSSSGSGFEVSSIEVTFTVSNYGAAAAAGEAAETVPFDASGVYHAYIGFQSPTYTFRNAWDGDDGYGNGTAEFDQITGWDESNNAVSRTGTLNDTVIDGNGTYKVSVTGVDFADDFANQDHMNLIFFSTDIPKGADVTFSDVILTINGSKQLNISNFVVTEDNTCLRVCIQNIWDTENGIDTLDYYPTPVTDIEIQFTVSGFDHDAVATEEPAADDVVAEDTTADTATDATVEKKDEKKGLSGGAIAGIVAGVVVVAGAGVGIGVASKKKKDN